MPPVVTIIVPNFNHAQYLPERLESIFSQTYENYEVLLLDDASSDDSPKLLEQYSNHPRVAKLIFNTQNSGSTFRQWNLGMENARGKYVWIAESDDRAHPEFLSKMVAALESDEKYTIAFSQSLRINEEGKVIGDWNDWTADLAPSLFDDDFSMDGTAFVEHLLLHRNVIPNASAALFRRNTCLSHGLADPAVKYCGDWLVWLKLALSGYVHYCAQPLNHFRQHSRSVIATRAGNRKSSFVKKYDIVMREKFSAHLESTNAPASLKNKAVALLRKDAEKEARLAIRLALPEDERHYAAIASQGAGGLQRLRLQLRLLAYRIKLHFRPTQS